MTDNLIILKPKIQGNTHMLELELAHKQLETQGCILSTVATDALVLKHQAIIIHSADSIFIVSDQFHLEILQL